MFVLVLAIIPVINFILYIFFQLPNDMENYMEYHVMGSVSQVRMKPGCMPHKFICQPDGATQISGTTERPYIAKKPRMILEECKNESEEKCTLAKQLSFEEIASSSSGTHLYIITYFLEYSIKNVNFIMCVT